MRVWRRRGLAPRLEERVRGGCLQRKANKKKIKNKEESEEGKGILVIKKKAGRGIFSKFTSKMAEKRSIKT